jgi:DNA-directed RNA polymerase subunit beta
MPWNRDNFHDASIISHSLAKEDIFASVHIAELEALVRESNPGTEKITRDVPNMGDESLKHFNRDGIARRGARLRGGNISVGEMAPKCEAKKCRVQFAADQRRMSKTVPRSYEGV